MLNVLIAHEQTLIRSGVKYILHSSPQISHIGEASTGLDVVRKLRTKNWHLLLLTVTLSDYSPLEILRTIQDGSFDIPVLLFNTAIEQQMFTRYLQAGASGYVSATCQPVELIEAIKRIANGGKYISPDLMDTLFAQLDPTGQLPNHHKLSDREFQVLQLMGNGKTITEIAHDLTLSTKTISTYRTRILQKLCLQNSAQIVQYAVKNQLIH